MAEPVSNTRLYLGNLHRDATKENVREYFEGHNTEAEIKEVKIMSGFGFIEYADEADARDVMAKTFSVNVSQSNLLEEADLVTPKANVQTLPALGVPSSDLKDFARKSGCDVVYSETTRGGETAFVEFESATDLSTAVEKLHGDTFKDHTVTCKPDIQESIPNPHPPRHGRSRSPRRAPYGAGYEDYRYGGPPRREYYGRERSPMGYRRDEYYARPRYEDPYARGPRYEDPYERGPRHEVYDERYPPPPRAYGGRPPQYERGRSPPPPRAAEYYDRPAPSRAW
ncbi:MAG: hypothetical protein M1814_006780 [Vezdaea aestivalis]|nr:MAG: hypothetical protein M1814_006780 [Vezdaea aestivalis]